MEKFKVDFSETSHFKGIRILFEYLEEGLKHAKDNNITDVCIWNSTDLTRQTVDFNFLKDFNWIKNFQWTVPLSKKSNIAGIYYLNDLTNFRWAVDCDFEIDFSKIPKIEILNVGSDHKLFTNWD